MSHSQAQQAVDSSFGAEDYRPQLKKAPGFAAPDLRLKSLMGGPQLKQSASEIAGQGFGGGGSSVPHLKSMQRSFGGIDFSGVRAHAGTPQAKQACETLGAEAYAMDGQVAFKSADPSPSVVAHELTHVVQQGHAGPQLKEEGEHKTGEGEEGEEEEEEEGKEGEGDKASDDPEAEAQEVEKNVAGGQPAKGALKSGGGGAAKTPAKKVARKPLLKLDKQFGAAVTFSAEEIEASASLSFNIPTTPIPLFAGVFIDLSAGFQLQLAGAIGLKRGGKVSVTGSAQGSAGLAIGLPNVMSGGFYATLQIPVSGAYEKDKDGNTFLGLKFEPGITTDARITVGPGWWTKAYKFSDTKIIIATLGWKNGKFQGFDWDWSPEMKTFIDAIKKVYDDAVGLISAGYNAVKKTARKVWDTLTSW